LYFLSMFLLVVILSVHVSFGSCNVCPRQYTIKRNMDRQYNDQKKHVQAIQRPKETWTDNTTTKRCIFWSLYCLSMFLLVFVLSVHVSFGLCIACSCFYW
jgi:hypothetical protein